MALTNEDEKTLQEVVDLEGDCLSKTRCSKCPFRSMCLPEFMNTLPPTKQQRKEMALKVLTHNALLDEEDSEKNTVSNYQWPSKEK